MANRLRLAPSALLRASSPRSHPWRTVSTVAAAPSSTGLRTGFYTTILLVSSGLFAAYYLDARSAIHRYLFTPLLRYGFDAETGQKLAVQVLRSGFGPQDPLADDARLKTEVRVALCRSGRNTYMKLSFGAKPFQTRLVSQQALTRMERL